MRGADGNNTLTSGGTHPARALPVLQFFDQGRCTVKGLAAGTYRFKVFHESMTLEPDSIRVPSPGGEPIVGQWTLNAR